MTRKLFLVGWLLLVGANSTLYSQAYCQKILDEATVTYQAGDLAKAMKQLQAAETCDYEDILQDERQNLQNKIFEAVNEAKKEAERSTKAALIAKTRAIFEKERADSLVVQANKAARVATSALADLQIANIKSVELILQEADRNILQLDYEAAFEKAQAAYELGANLPESKKCLQEIAFVYTETEQWGKADTCLQVLDIVLKNASKTAYLEKIKSIDTQYYKILPKRYYPEMVSIVGGVCEMSADYQAKLNNFHLAKTETTNWQYYLFVTANQREMKSPSWQFWGDNPVVNVSWYDATEYMNWLSDRQGKTKTYFIDKTQKDTNNLSSYDDLKWVVEWKSNTAGYRLPTESEWEYAAKGGQKKDTFDYTGSNEIAEVAWYRANSKSRTQPVARKKSNALGLHDMSGNVREWCWDWYSDYPENPELNPKGRENGSYRVLRGGSWYFSAEYSSVSYRPYYFPYSRSSSDGFRVAYSQ